VQPKTESNLDLRSLEARELADRIRARAVSPVEVVDASLARIASVDPVLNACTVVLEDDARAQARAAERVLMAGDQVGPLHGVPVAIKDAIWVKDQPATMGSRALADFRPEEDAVVVRRLRDAGAILVAKTTNPELLWSGYTRSELYGVSRNPWNTERSPGGSSGGSGAAVASGIVPLALGTDAGGSIRLPAAFCGIVGLKPSHGVVPRCPGFEEGRSVNVFGPLTRSVADARLALQVIAGPDPADNLSVPLAGPQELTGPAIDLRIAWTPTVEDHSLDRSVASEFDKAIGTLEQAGWQLVEACPRAGSLAEFVNDVYLGELPPMLAGREHLLSAPIREIVAESRRLTATDYYDAQLRRAGYARIWEAFFDRYDALLTPAAAMPPFPADPQEPILIDGKAHDLDQDLGYLLLNMVANLVGGPAVTVPIGVNEDGLPVGIQIMTGRFGDWLALMIAEEIEAAFPRLEMPFRDASAGVASTGAINPEPGA
jgi:Asp-tRNA(Asn)/Glu-tRNA(Gln) amidotransferase A subunit family amidase